MRGISPVRGACIASRPLPKGECAVRVTTAAEMRELDRLAIETYGIPGVVLMENAGAQVVRILWQEYPDLQARRVAVLCGRGNNGGDGFVIARYLHNMGVSVSVFIMGEPGGIRGDAGAASGHVAARRCLLQRP